MVTKLATTVFTLALLVVGCSVLPATATGGGIGSATTNYASSYLGAKIADHHPEAKGTHNILNEDKDKYMIIPCRERRKQFTIQLSREVELSIITISNLEYFSSPVKNFTLLGSNQYPCLQSANCMWRVLGSFEAEFTRATQQFVVQKQPSIRFLRFQWVSHHEHEKSCTLTTLQAYGTDMLEILAAELNSPHDNNDDDENESEDDNKAGRTEAQYVSVDVASPGTSSDGAEANSTEGGPIPAGEAIGLNHTAGTPGTGHAPNTTAPKKEQQRKKWKLVPVLFPPRNSTTTLSKICQPSDKEAEIFYEQGPGARCYKRAKPKDKEKGSTHTASNLLVLPHIGRQLKAHKEDITKLQRQMSVAENTLQEILKKISAMEERQSKEERMQQANMETVWSKISGISHQLRALSTGWELRFSAEERDQGGGTSMTVLLVCLGASNIVVILLVAFTCYQHRMTPAALPHHPVPHPAGVGAHGADGSGVPMQLRRNSSMLGHRRTSSLFPLAGSTANLEQLDGVLQEDGERTEESQ